MKKRPFAKRCGAPSPSEGKASGNAPFGGRGERKREPRSRTGLI